MDDKQIFFSVVIPNYNRAGLILRTVESVLRQTYRQFEVIVVDDGSTDESVAVIHKGVDSPQVRVVVLEQNCGVHVARNRGIVEAKGEYIVFLDSDDELLPDALASFCAVARMSSEISIISAPYRDDDGDTTGLNLVVDGYVSYSDLISQRLSKKNKAGLTCVQKAKVERIRFVAPNLDYIFYRYMMRTGSTYYIARPLGLYHRVGKVGNQNYERKLPKPQLSVKRADAIEHFLMDFKDDLILHSPELFAGYAHSASVGLLLAGKRSRALVRAFEAFWYSKGKVGYCMFLALNLLPFASKLLWLFFQYKIRYTKARNTK